MRWSQLFIPTLREEPANVEAVSHKLLVRAGYIRQLTAGVYSLLPLAQRVRLKIVNIIREEMDGIGAQEFLLSALQPVELWEESGRLQAVSDIMFRFKDRKGSQLALGLTHEEVFTSIARNGLVSYKQLPQIWYQIQTKFRDEARPKGGLLRVREFTMKDSYSFDLDTAGLDQSFDKHHEAYVRIFNRCGLSFRAVQANSGAMGGSKSVEFMALTTAGEDTLILCDSCEYAANVERAESKTTETTAVQDADSKTLEEVATPGIKTVKELTEFCAEASATNQIKTLVFVAETGLVLALVQGDQELNEAKLQSLLGTATLRAADAEEIFKALGAHPGSLGACGVKAVPARSGSSASSGSAAGSITTIVADSRLHGRSGMFTGANKDDFHLRNVAIDRDIKVDKYADLHTVQAKEICITCGGTLQLSKGLEIGHIFKLGTRYSEIMNAYVLGADGAKIPLVMGSYGIGAERLMAAVVELSHDEKGLIWPASIAPFDVVVVPVNGSDPVQAQAAEDIRKSLKALNIDVLMDDRDERAGVKFNDAELIGIPYRITIGKKIGSGIVELFDRSTKINQDVPLAEVAQKLKETLAN